jgi:hypothetical protein
MAMKSASDVARRCLSLELLLQRLGLEVDDDDPAEERDEVRIAWQGRLPDLGVLEDELVGLAADERAFMELPVGELTEENVDEIETRVIGALLMLWSLKRIGARPSASTLGDATRLMAEYGVLGDGSISKANATVKDARLRPESELREALAGYAAKQGDGRIDGDPEQMVAVLAVKALAWVLGD